MAQIRDLVVCRMTASMLSVHNAVSPCFVNSLTLCQDMKPDEMNIACSAYGLLLCVRAGVGHQVPFLDVESVVKDLPTVQGKIGHGPSQYARGAGDNSANGFSANNIEMTKAER